MVRIKAVSHYHGSDGFKHPNQEWEVSEAEAKELVSQGKVTYAASPKQGVVKEDKIPLSTKEDKSNQGTK